MFHPDSYGYRPGRSALDAVEACRRRCWNRDWVIDLDIRAFFDSLDHELILKAVAAHTRAAVDPALPAAVAHRAAAAAGWNSGATRSRDSARIGDLTVVGESVSALRLRQLARHAVPGGQLRAVRG